ncbi:MAG: carbon-nitrogen hydrolase family protein [Deltaproteobacteria bacterium]|nr:carbon-nitrogen hydrolase family protein [Deltaproteobacteria bacterium]
MEKIKAAAIQICASSNKEENYKKVSHYVEQAAGEGARFIVLPEHWDWLGKPQEKKSHAESPQGPSIQFAQGLAKKFNCWLVAGTFAEQAADEKPPYNTSLTIHPDGKIGKVYRKIHLFDADVMGGHKESEWTSAGCEVVVEDLGWGKVGMSVCYDIRFPELYRELAVQGANVILIPANFTAYTGVAHWEVLVRARAIENQCFVIAAGQTGVTGAGWEAHGYSMIVDPWGEILASAGKEEGFITATLDFNRLKDVRAKMPVHSHRKLR